MQQQGPAASQPPPGWTTPDGRYRWNGRQWVPLGSGSRTTGIIVLTVLGSLFVLFLLVMVLLLVALAPAIVGLYQAFH